MTEEATAYPGSECQNCGNTGDLIGVGSATGRPEFHCPKCGYTWHGKNPAAVLLGQLGGRARAKILTPERRQKIAEKAGNAFAEKMREKRRNQ